jgi:hypothetical protein
MNVLWIAWQSIRGILVAHVQFTSGTASEQCICSTVGTKKKTRRKFTHRLPAARFETSGCDGLVHCTEVFKSTGFHNIDHSKAYYTPSLCLTAIFLSQIPSCPHLPLDCSTCFQHVCQMCCTFPDYFPVCCRQRHPAEHAGAAKHRSQRLSPLASFDMSKRRASQRSLGTGQQLPGNHSGWIKWTGSNLCVAEQHLLLQQW